MIHYRTCMLRLLVALLFLGCFVFHTSSSLRAQTVKIVLKDGRIYEGKVAELTKVDEKSEVIGQVRVKLITVMDDGLRYIYFPKYNIRPDLTPEPSSETYEIFQTGLSYAREGQKAAVLGEYDTKTRFDAVGRRLLFMQHIGGVELVTQAITEIRPQYVRVRGVHINNNPFVWDMRLATGGIPRDQLTPILMKQINPEDYDDRIRLVRFYNQGNQFDSAIEELDAIMKDWNDDPDIKRRLSGVYRMIDQYRHRRWLDDLELRWKSGQYNLVRHFLGELENKDDLPEQYFMTVGNMLKRYDDFEKNRSNIITQLKSLYEQIPADEKDDRILPILKEIEADLSLNTIDRLATFTLVAGDKELAVTEKLAIGITGWFAGSNADNRRLAVAASFPETRRLIFEYLRSGDNKVLQDNVLEKLKALESSRPDLIAKILAYIKPPKDNPDASSERPGYYRFEIDNPVQGTDVAKLDYLVQLPPEYDPNRRYPMIVTLNGLNSSPDMQLDWWAGPWRGTERYGQASRHGYIVIAPNWNPQKLLHYDFSALAHASVLCSVRDAFRRFGVDTDRVYLSGHGLGGTAAWDIALGHPDLWAGAIPFNGVADRYIVAYQNNPQHVPLYLVSGELEGVGNELLINRNAMVLNRYLARQHKPFEVTVVRFIGRGTENFSDEIQRIFEWMKLHQRNFNPLEFEVDTVRPWDNFFWWVELGDFARERPERAIDPIFWSGKGLPKTLSIKSRQNKNTNSLQVDIGPKLQNVVLYLTPDNVDFNSKASIRVGNKNYHPRNGYVEPDIEVMLYDAKTRGDRLHPFWVKLDGSKND